MRRSLVLVAVLATLMLAAALLPGGPHTGAVMAQAGSEPGLAVSLRVDRQVMQRGESLDTTLELANLGDGPLNITLGCNPGNDLQVYNAEGQRIWRLHPECTEQNSTLTLAAGEKRTWLATWPGTNGDGATVRTGRYTLYGFVRARPLAAVAGPMLVEVEGIDDPTVTPTVRPPEPTATPVVSGTNFPIADGDGRQVRPDVAGNPELGECQNLVVWWDETAQKIYGRWVAPNWRSEPILISGESTAVGPAKVAMNASRRRWLVVWTSASDAGPTVIYGRYVDCGALESNVFRLGLGNDTPPVGDDQPAVADFGESWVVTWRRARDGGGHDIVGSRMVGLTTPSLNQLSDPAVSAVSEPAVDCEPRGPCLVAWTADLGGGGGDIMGAEWLPDDTSGGVPQLTIAATDLAESYPSVAWNNTYDRAAYAVTWTEARQYDAVMARTVFRGGDPAQPMLYTLGTTVEVRFTLGGAFHGDVAAVGPDFVAVWAEAPLVGAPAIRARRLRYSPDNRDLTPGDVVEVNDGAERELYPAVASARDPLALAVWQVERDGGGADILGRHVALPAGQVTMVGSVVGGSVASGAAVAGTMARGTAAKGPKTGLMSRLQQTTLRVKVRRVLRGEFNCPEATVFVASGATTTQPVTGDLVSLHAVAAPDQGACALQIGPPGTYLLRGPQLQAHLPFGMAR